MEKYAIIKDWAIIYVTDYVPKKRESVSESVDAESEEYWMDYDEAIPFDFDGNPAFVDGKIVPDTSEIERRKSEIIKRLGEISVEKSWLEILKKDVSILELEIENLKSEYESISVG